MSGRQPARWTQTEELLASMMDLNLDQSDEEFEEGLASDRDWEAEDEELDAAAAEDDSDGGEWYNGGVVGDGDGGEDDDGKQGVGDAGEAASGRNHVAAGQEEESCI